MNHKWKNFFKLFDRTFFRLSFQFLLLVAIGFTILIAVGIYEVSKGEVESFSSPTVPARR